MPSVHNNRHKDLMRGLALGILTDHELNAAAALLENCAECERALGQYRRDLGTDNEVTAEVPEKAEEKHLQLPITLGGSLELVYAALRRINEIASNYEGTSIEHLVVTDVSDEVRDDEVRNVVSLRGKKGEMILEVERVLLQGITMSGSVRVGIGACFVRDELSGVLRIAPREAGGEVSANALAQFIVESGGKRP